MAEENQQDMRERIIKVVTATYARDYKKMELETDVSAAKWKRMCNRVQQPTIKMIESLGKRHPYFILYMNTGKAQNYVQVNPNDDWRKILNQRLLIQGHDE